MRMDYKVITGLLFGFVSLEVARFIDPDPMLVVEGIYIMVFALLFTLWRKE